MSALALVTGAPARAEHQINKQDRKDGLPCHLQVQVSELGIVQAAQVLQSVGSTYFDEICLNSVIARHLTPNDPDGVSHRHSGWFDLKVNVIMLLPRKETKALQDRAPRPVPALKKETTLDLDLPMEPSNLTRPVTVCAVHVRVATTGTAADVALLRSTGDAALDDACLRIIRESSFIPAQQNNEPIEATTEIWLN